MYAIINEKTTYNPVESGRIFFMIKMIKIAERIQNVEEYYFSKKLKEIALMQERGIEVINLGVGSPDMLPPSFVVDELKNALSYEKSHQYQSYIGLPELRKGFTTWYERFFQVQLNPLTEVLPLLGSKEGILHTSMAFVNKGDTVLIPNPGYPTYSSVAKLLEANIVYYDLEEKSGWLPDLEKLKVFFQKGVKLMWLNYPHMPTGAKATLDFYEKIVSLALSYGVLLINDNPYSFIRNEEHLSIFRVKGAKKCALEMNSLSKSHNMSGYRVGALFGCEEFISAVLRVKTNIDSGMFYPIQRASIVALEAPQSWYDELNALYERRAVLAGQVLEQLGCTFEAKSVGLFLIGKVPAHYKDAFQLSDEILEKYGLFVTPGGIFGSQAKDYLRISLCSSEAIFEEALERIKSKGI